MTIWFLSANINSGVRPSHLLTKGGVCVGVRVQSHACYDQACVSVSKLLENRELRKSGKKFFFHNSIVHEVQTILTYY